MKAVRFLVAILFSVVLGNVMASATGLNPYATSGVLMATSFIPKPTGILAMALDVEIWKPYIIGNLFKGNEFLNFAFNADEHVLQGKVVHIPNAAAPSAVKRNRTQLPASVTKRTDVDITYALDEFTSDPRLIPDADKILSYDKMDSAMGEDMRWLRQIVAEWMLYHWRPEASADFQIRTTGASTAAHLSGATGNRKKLQLDNLEEAQARMDDNDMPEDGRYALFSGRMHQQLVSELTTSDYKDFSRAYDQAKGIVGELFGFKILKRSSVLRATNATNPVIKDPDAAAGTTDNDLVLCWQQDAVERAIGEVKVFENKEDPTYYGDIFSMLIRAGGRKRRDDHKGVIGIIQASA